MPDNSNLLTVGTAMGWVKLFDLRLGMKQPAVSLMAHPASRQKKLRGIRSDPFCHCQFATFTDGAGDAVKLWDLRKVTSSKASATQAFIVIPADSTQANVSMAAVLDVAWSPLRSNILAVSNNAHKQLSFYSTAKQASEHSTSSPLYSVTMPDIVRSMSWQGTVASARSTYQKVGTVFDIGNIDRETSEKASAVWDPFKSDELLHSQPFGQLAQQLSGRSVPVDEESAVLASMLRNCPILASTASGLVLTDVKEQVALACSNSDVIVTGSDEHLQMLSLHPRDSYESALADNVSPLMQQTHLSQAMKKRCAAGYALDLVTNIEILSAEIDAIYSKLHQSGQFRAMDLHKYAQVVRPDVKQQHIYLLELAELSERVFRMWTWVERFESLTNQITNLTLTNCGVLDIIQSELLLLNAVETATGHGTSTAFHSRLGCQVFMSKNRYVCKRICGWVGIVGQGTAVDPLALSPSTDDVHGVFRTRRSTRSSADETVYSGSFDIQETTFDGRKEDGLLEIIVSECQDSFERVSTIALWHGDLDLAVKVLYKAIESYETLLSSANSARSLATAVNWQSPKTYVSAPMAEDAKDVYSPSIAGRSPRSPRDDADEDEEAVMTAHKEELESRIEWDVSITAEYMQLISLVSMCFAGYSYEARMKEQQDFYQRQQQLGIASADLLEDRKINGSVSSWVSMCRHVLDRLNKSNRKATKYLAGACEFLLINLRENDVRPASRGAPKPLTTYDAILNDVSLNLEDRVAFALTFLSNQELVDWLALNRDLCMDQGWIDGLLITGLSHKEGMEILQQYIDHFDDIQTVSLLVSQVVDNSVVEGSVKPTREWLWLNEYRQLLNKWELFTERAKLDVELGKRYRAKAAVAAARGSAKLQGAGPKGTPMSFAAKSIGKQYPPKHGQDRSKRVMYKIPPHSEFPHIYLRCSYCGTSLPLDAMQLNKADQLRSQKSILNCCAGCSKQLPRCYVCQLYMGMVNPYLELNRTMTQKRISSDQLLALSEKEAPPPPPALHLRKPGGVPGESLLVDINASFATTPVAPPTFQKSDHHVLDFGKWFFFCQHCRHGGHANCIDAWFRGGAELQQLQHIMSPNSLPVRDQQSTTYCMERVVCGVNGCNCNCKTRR